MRAGESDIAVSAPGRRVRGDLSAFRIVKDRYERTTVGRKGVVARRQNAKTPVMRWLHPPGSLGSSGGAWLIQVTSRKRVGGYFIPVPNQLKERQMFLG